MSEADPKGLDPLRALPPDLAVPRDETGPVFAEPWEARVFAMVVEMNARGLFGWGEFQSLLVDEIRRSEGEGLCRPYYMNWLLAAERLFEARGLVEREATDAEVERLRPDDRTIRLR